MKAMNPCRFWNPFGAEYGWRPEWNLFERIYIRTFGVVDLPSRLRARLVIAFHPWAPGEKLPRFRFRDRVLFILLSTTTRRESLLHRYRMRRESMTVRRLPPKRVKRT